MNKITVCIPVYNTEVALVKCLESIGGQSFTDFEVILVNDCSPIKKEISVKTVFEEFTKTHPKINIKLIEHSKNKGCIEARRTAVELCQTEYLTFIDSDDELYPNSLQDFYDKAVLSQADIVHGLAKVNTAQNISEEIKTKLLEIQSLIHVGLLKNTSMLNSFFVECKYNGCLWGKLFKTEIVKKAFLQMPQMYCIMGEDLCISFFINYFAKSYFGFNDSYIYKYNFINGITTPKKITDLTVFEKCCSAASIFTVLYMFLQENSLPPEYLRRTQEHCVFYLNNNLSTLKNVVPQLYNEAHAVLCDYWGESLVKKIQSVHK